MTNLQPDRFDRMEALLERVINLQASQQEQVEVLLNTAIRHDVKIAKQDILIERQNILIERLDTIIERMVYREGRNGDSEPLQS